MTVGGGGGGQGVALFDYEVWIPAFAGMTAGRGGGCGQGVALFDYGVWIPAFAGMTEYEDGNPHPACSTPTAATTIPGPPHRHSGVGRNPEPRYSRLNRTRPAHIPGGWIPAFAGMTGYGWLE